MHYLLKTKYKFLIILSLLITIGVNLIDYMGIMKANTNDYSLIYRGIDSNFKFLFFGVFGIFFNLKISCFTFLFIAIALYYVTNFFKLNRNTQLFLLCLMFILGLIMSKGFFNYRYITTLLPLILFIIVIEYHKAYPKIFSLKYLTYFFVFILAMVVLSIVYFILNTNPAKKQGNKYKNKIEWIQLGVPRYLKSQFEEDHQSNLFYQRLDSILLQSKKNVLVNNIPEYYLKCKSKGIYYWCGDDILYLKTSHAKLLSNTKNDFKPEEIMAILNGLNVEFILSMKEYNEYSPQFKNFINSSTTISLEEGELTLYKINSSK
jgi:hypothetical protein